jgi:hypothetical protein
MSIKLWVQIVFYTVYKTTNTLDGKSYIGKHQTKDLDDGYMGSGKHLKRAIEKYGISNFQKEILFQFDNEIDMNAKEAELVTEEFCLRVDTYNMCVGGKGGFSYIRNHSEYSNWQLKGSQAGVNTNLQRGGQHWKDLSEAGRKGLQQKIVENSGIWWDTDNFKGKTHSKETKAKMSLSHKDNETNVGDKNSQYGTMWITNGLENNKVKRGDQLPEGWRPGRKIKNANQNSC